LSPLSANAIVEKGRTHIHSFKNGTGSLKPQKEELSAIYPLGKIKKY